MGPRDEKWRPRFHGILISRHAAKRGKERMGLKRSALARKTADAVQRGERIADKKPTDPHRLRMVWATEKFAEQGIQAEHIHFDGWFFIIAPDDVTSDPVLVTVFPDNLFMDQEF